MLAKLDSLFIHLKLIPVGRKNKGYEKGLNKVFLSKIQKYRKKSYINGKLMFGLRKLHLWKWEHIMNQNLP